jgi:LemA protein
MFFGLLVFAAIVLGVVGFAAAYNNLVTAAHRAAQAWGNVDALLRQRHDELPRLIDAWRQHVKHEHAAVESVLEARTAVFAARQTTNIAALSEAEAALRTGLATLRAFGTSNAGLAADPAFTALDQRIAALDAGIAERSAIYNEAVQQNNATVAGFPGRIVALLGAFRSLQPFEF